MEAIDENNALHKLSNCCMLASTVGHFGARDCPMEFPPYTNPKWASSKLGGFGNVGQPFLEICGSVQVPVWRWAAAVPCANEDRYSKDCLGYSFTAGNRTTGPERFFPFLPSASRAALRIINSRVASLRFF